MKNLTLPKQASVLKIAAVSIAAPRFAAVFVAAAGQAPLELYPFLIHLEAISGFAMALLEGFAISFIFSRWKLLKPASPTWISLAVMLTLLTISLPLIASPYLLAELKEIPLADVFSGDLAAFSWTFVLTLTPMLIVAAVGLADIDEHERKLHLKQAQARVKQASKLPEATPQATPEQTFSCPTCSKSFPSAKALGGHQAHCKVASSNGSTPQLETSKEAS